MVHASGCEPHSRNFAGSYLLTRSENQWRIISYQPSLLTSRCWRVNLSSGRQKLLCLAESGTGGLNIATIYLIDALTPPNFDLLDPPAGSLFTIADTTNSCGQNTHAQMDDPAIPLHRETLDAVAYHPKPADGIHLRITASVGERKLSRLELKQCLATTNDKEKARFFPAMRTYPLNFRFDGQTFTPTPSTRQVIPRFAAIAKP